MEGNNGQPPPQQLQFQLQSVMVQALSEAAAAIGTDPNQILNVWLLLGKRVFDSQLMVMPFAMALAERTARLAATEPTGKEPDEEDTSTAEQRIEELRAIARGELAPSAPTPSAEGVSEDEPKEPS
jgi:hypothetical protein